MEQKPIKKRKQQAIDTKQRIFDAAMVLIEEYGFENVQIDDISNKAGVSTGSFYKYFANKSEIISENLIRRCDQQYLRISEKYLNDLRAKERLQEFCHRVLEYQILSESKNDLQKNYSILLTSEQKSEFIVNNSRSFFSIINQCVTEMVEDGELSDDVNSKQITKNVMIVIRGCIFDYLLNRTHEPSTKIVEQYCKVIHEYIAGMILIHK